MSKWRRVLATVLTVVMLVGAFPVGGIIFSASALRIEADRDFTVGQTLDYSALFDKALIVVPGLDAGGNVNYSYRGRAVSEPYSASRHFATLGDAVAAAKGEAAVFYLAAGSYSGVCNVPADSVLLGANAGITPNGYINFKLPDVTKGWDAADRFDETVITSGIVSDGSIVIDGISFEGSGALFTATDADSQDHSKFKITVQNSLISGISEQSPFFDTSACYSDSYGFDIKDTRISNTASCSTFCKNTYAIHTDGLYFYNNTGVLIDCVDGFSEYEFSLDMCRTYMYKNKTTTYSLNAYYTPGDHKSQITLDSFLWYESTETTFGVIRFYTTPDSKFSTYNVDIINSTFLADKSYNNVVINTFINGNQSSYQLGSYNINVNNNRIIGFGSMFPNISGQEGTHKIHADFNNNYFASSFKSVGDVAGKRSEYYNYTKPHGTTDFNNIDFARLDLLNYYTDYAMTLSDKTFDINGVSFYDYVDYVSIDNKNDIVSVGMRAGSIVSPVVYFENEAVDAKIYNDIYCNDECEGFSAPTRGKMATYYIRAICGSTEKVIPLYVYGEEAVPYFKNNYSDASGRIKNTAYLLCPEGAVGDIEVEFDGSPYLFTVGSNAFSSVDKILDACDGVPQIILPYGEYDDIEINGDCEIYGQNRSSAVYTSLDSECVIGVGWVSGKSAKLSKVGVNSGNVGIYGVELTDAVSVENGACLTVENSKVHSLAVNGGVGTVGVRGCAVASGELITGVLPATVFADDCYFANGSALSSAGWNVENYDVPCSFSVNGCYFDGVSKTVLSDARTGRYTDDTDIAFSVTDCIFNVSDTSVPSMSIRPYAYNRVVITGNRFVSNSDKGTPIYFDNSAQPSSVVFTRNRFIGFSVIATATDEFPVDGSYNYFAKYSDDYKTANNGTVIPGNIYCSDYYTDYMMTNALPSVSGFEFSDSITVLQRNLTFKATGNTTDMSKHITAECGMIVIDLQGNECDLSALESEYDITVYTVVFYNPLSPCSRIEYRLDLVREIPDGCNIISASSDASHVEKNSHGVYTMTLPASLSDADLSIVTDGGEARLYLDGAEQTGIVDMPEGARRDYDIVVTSQSGSVRYRLTVTRPVSSGVVIDYDAAVDDAYIVGAERVGENIRFYYRGDTVTKAYDAARHFDTFEQAYSAYLATDPDIIYDTPVFILAPGSYGDITVKYRAIILGANAGIKPLSSTAPGSEPFDTPTVNSARSYSHSTRFLGSILRVADDATLEQIENEKDARLEMYTVVDGVDISSSAVFISENGDRRHSIYIQNTVSSSPLVAGGGKGEITLKNVKVGGTKSPVISAVTDSITVDDSYIYGVSGSGVLSGATDSISVKNSFISSNACGITVAVTGDAVMENNIIASTPLALTSAGSFVMRCNTLSGGSSVFVLDGIAATVAENRLIGYTHFDVDNVGVNYMAANYQDENDVCGLPLGDDWYIDYKLTLKRSDFNVAGVAFADGVHGAVIDNEISYISILLTNNESEKVTFIPVGQNVQMRITLDGSEVSELSGGNTYTLSLTKGGYTHTVTAFVENRAVPFFTETDGIGIIKNTAVMISPNVIADNGDGKIIEWRGKEYKFVYGQNLFNSIYEAREKLDGYLQMMLPAYDFEDEIIMPVNTSLYGVNFDVDPNIKSDELGDDWAKNPDWGRYGHTEIHNLSVPYEATGTLMEIYGITLRGRIFDGNRPISELCTEFNIINTLVEHEEWTETIYGGTSYMYTITLTNSNSTSGSKNIDRGMIKNMRVEKLRVNPEIVANRNRLLNERLPSDFTVDGLYLDMEKADCSLIGWMKMSNNQKNGQVTYKNCNIRNGINVNSSLNLAFEGRDHAEASSADGIVATIDNCTFYNTQIGSKSALQFALQAYSRLNVTNNLFLSTTTPSAQVFTFTAQSTLTGHEFNVKNNRFVGVRNTINLTTGSGNIDLSDNYYASYTANYKNGVSGKALSGTRATCSRYYTDYALNFKNTDIKPYAFGGGMTVDMKNKTLSLTLDARDGNSMSLNNYIVSNPSGHTFTVSGGHNISSIPLVNGENTFTVTVAGTDRYTLTVTLISIAKTLSDRVSEALRIIEKDSFSRYTVTTSLALRRAYNEARLLLEDGTANDRQLTTALTALESAMSALTVDTAELSDKLASCPQNIDSRYTAASYVVLSSVMDEARSYSTFSPELVDRLIADIDAALAGLVDMKQYNDALSAARSVDANRYSQAAYTAFSAEIEKISSQAVIQTDEDVARESARIRSAYSLLAVTRAGLDAALTYAGGLDPADWTFLSYNAVTSAVDNASAITDLSTQGEIDAATADINEAIAALVDASYFGNTMKRARAIVNDGRYSDQSWKAFVTRLNEIEALSKRYLTTQQANDGAADIVLAIAGLTVDTAALSEALKKAEEHPRSGYTSASLSVLDAAIQNARNVKEGAVQNEIVALVNALNSAVSSLVSVAPLDEAVKKLEAITNTANKYCADSFAALRAKAAALRSRINSVATPEQATSFLAEAADAQKLVKAHSYVYKNNNDATCRSLATRTGRCACGATVTVQIANSLVAHKCNSYIYNNDATYAKDGTSSGKCIWCQRTVTVTAVGTRLKVTPIDSSRKFNDVVAGAWYTTAVDYAVGAGFISGMSDTVFGVSTSVTRGMFITILARIAGVDTMGEANNTTTKFADVDRGKYYTAAIKWGVQNGVVSGVSGTEFAPDDEIQRQQLCVMIVNFARFSGVEIGVAEPAISFSDSGTIGNYAKAAVKTCQMADIVNGYNEGSGILFKPQNTATRAEAAQILYKFHSTYVAK